MGDAHGRPSPPPLGTVEVISLDVGGVLVVPDHAVLAEVLASAGVAHDPSRFEVGHYHAMAEVDRAGSAPETFGDYLHGFLASVGVPVDQRPAGRRALEPVFGAPVWRQPLPWAADGLSALVAAGLRLVVTSNSDGSVGAVLDEIGLAQVGEGPGAPLVGVVDSGELGVAKPDPAVFERTCALAGVDARQILHVGDSVHYDVHGARAVGMVGVHFDPHGLCSDDGHDHVARLDALVDLVGRGPRP